MKFSTIKVQQSRMLGQIALFLEFTLIIFHNHIQTVQAPWSDMMQSVYHLTGIYTICSCLNLCFVHRDGYQVVNNLKKLNHFQHAVHVVFWSYALQGDTRAFSTCPHKLQTLQLQRYRYIQRDTPLDSWFVSPSVITWKTLPWNTTPLN